MNLRDTVLVWHEWRDGGFRVPIFEGDVKDRHLERVLFDDPFPVSEDDLGDYITQMVLSQAHPVGTTRMGPDEDAGAVVDQYCCVRGTERLRVVDASVMPKIPRANINLTCIMIGERGAEWG